MNRRRDSRPGDQESKVRVEVDIDGSGRADVWTGVGFYDHMLTSFARHALVDLVAHTSGDTHIDAHHTVEDTAIVLGEALREALGDKSGIRGSVTRPCRSTRRWCRPSSTSPAARTACTPGSRTPRRTS